jgi:hypothetical protein
MRWPSETSKKPSDSTGLSAYRVLAICARGERERGREGERDGAQEGLRINLRKGIFYVLGNITIYYASCSRSE